MEYLYKASDVRELDAMVAQELGVSFFHLMERAGRAAFEILIQRWPNVRKIAVVCGKGLNGGDGLIVAGHARAFGIEVQAVLLSPMESLDADTVLAKKWAESQGVEVQQGFTGTLSGQVIVDAILGSGFKGELRPEYSQAAEAINRNSSPVLSIDIPTGVSADGLASDQNAINAAITVTFIGRKVGLYTGSGYAYAGEVIYQSLGAPGHIFKKIDRGIPLLDFLKIPPLDALALDSHKHSRGHTVIVGGDHSMGGAILMAGESALRVGAGLVTIIGRKAHGSAVLARRPEIMFVDAADRKSRAAALAKADAIVVGPGMGTNDWGLGLLQEALIKNKLLVLDADALKLIGAVETRAFPPSIVTPHAGEAAAMLGISSEEIDNDRLAASKTIARVTGGVSILKGPGTVIASKSSIYGICKHGNPGMATAGMGDVLSGILGGLLCQGIELRQAAEYGTCLHSAAADMASNNMGERGLVAMDLMVPLTQLMNNAK